MKNFKILIVALVCISVLPGWGFNKNKKTLAERRQEVLEMRDTVLADVYKEAPGIKEMVDNAVGYAVFSSLGLNLFVVSSANGPGLAHYNSNGKDVFMKMYSAGVGIGMGVKDFRLLFVFQTEKALNNFIVEGWAASTQADAAAKHGAEGTAASLAIDVAPGVKLFQQTESGLALQATIQGTKYYLDKDLN